MPRVQSIYFAAGSQSHAHFDEKLHDSVAMVTREHCQQLSSQVHRLSKDICEASVHSLSSSVSLSSLKQATASSESSAHKEGVLKEGILLAYDDSLVNKVDELCLSIIFRISVINKGD
ncbi:hypothetical protein A6R68_11061, partial [Neotoma lepida]